MPPPARTAAAATRGSAPAEVPPPPPRTPHRTAEARGAVAAGSCRSAAFRPRFVPRPGGVPDSAPPPPSPPSRTPRHRAQSCSAGSGPDPPGTVPPPPSPRAMTVTLFFHCARGAPGGAQSRTPPPFPDPNPTPEGEGRGGGWGAAPPIRTAEGDSGGANNSAERSPRSAPPPPHFPPQHRDTAPRGAPPGPTGVICGAAPARQRHAATPPPPPPRCTPHSPVGTPPPGPARPQLSRLRRPLKVTRESCAAGTARGGGCGLRAGGEMGGVGTPHRPAWVSAEPCGTRGRCSAAAAMGMRGRG